MVVNVPGGPTFSPDTEVSTHLTEYVGSAPGKDSGDHRYSIVFYEQTKGTITVKDLPRISKQR